MFQQISAIVRNSHENMPRTLIQQMFAEFLLSVLLTTYFTEYLLIRVSSEKRVVRNEDDAQLPLNKGDFRIWILTAASAAILSNLS